MAEPTGTPATPAAKPAATATATAAAAAPPSAPRDFVSLAMKQLFVLIQDQQKRLGWSETKLSEFANQVLGPTDPYKKLKITTTSFISRLRVPLLQTLLAALQKAS